MSALDFIKKYFGKINPQFIFVGSDFRFGRDRIGDINLLRKAGERAGFKICTVTFFKKMGSIISSTKIRKLIAQGQIGQASRLLGHRVSLIGKVTRGEGRGRKIGFPTANIQLDRRLVVPSGVYAVQIRMDDQILYGMANVGLRPSFNDTTGKRAEVHIFDFHKDIYGRKIKIDFLTRIRPERKFLSKQALTKQLHKDELKVRRLFKKRPLDPSAISY
jgi:riboflavin kinase/FMN adenylyltransferase